ncbi:ATP-binding protein [Desulfosediminicola flagellatus]|uniref:ATP-binding protein n=1 Tax=Desulfosediminicola flagellatus TaxID=2569541 RepID=UPI0010AD7B54|nr:ATP-binding protein [Desulfosediminicola flagellatus]
MKIKIKHKLFFTLLLTSTVVAAGLFVFLQWSFDRGFLNYVKNQELAQLDQLADRLSGYYAEQGSWDFLEDNYPLWFRIHSEVFLTPGRPMPRMDSGRKPFPAGHIGPPHDPEGIRGRIVLYNADKHKIIGGPPGDSNDLKLLDITRQGKTIGYLGLAPVMEISASGDLRFVEQQTETFALVTLVMLAVSILLSFPVAIHLLRPIRQLTDGTLGLIGGKFSTRIPVTTGDELGQLSEHFNILAMTLEKNEKSRQQWVADISHELRTPLAVLRGEVEALQDGVREMGPATLDPLHSEIMHLQRLVNDLYELSMSDIGALTYKRVAVNPVGILGGTVELFEQRFLTKGIELAADLPENFPGSLLGDPDRLHQLFTNVLENSLRYTDVPGKLEVRITHDNEYVTIVFEDSSPGVGEAQLPKLFDKLFRADPSRNREGNGAGLGLAICLNIVEAHLGNITAYASPYGGLGIRIELPLS